MVASGAGGRTPGGVLSLRYLLINLKVETILQMNTRRAPRERPLEQQIS